MAFYGAFFWLTPNQCLDEEFDAPDIGADRELCRAIAAGRMGMHPDAWGSHDLLTTLPPHHRRYEPPEPAPAYDPTPAQQAADEAWEAEHRRRPVDWDWAPKPKPKPKWQIPWTWVPTATPAVDSIHGGTIELTCDDCKVRFRILTNYDHGQRARRATGLRLLGAKEGWTHILGRDRCPACSGIPAPDDVGNGAGEAERDKQHADGG